MSVHVRTEDTNGSVRVGEEKRTITVGRRTFIVGVVLLALISFGAFALGLYRQQPTLAPSALVAPSVPAEEAAPAEETAPVEQANRVESERKHQTVPIPVENAITEAFAPPTSRKPQRTRPARPPRRASRKRTSKADEAAPVAATSAPASERSKLYHRSKKIVLEISP